MENETDIKKDIKELLKQFPALRTELRLELYYGLKERVGRYFEEMDTLKGKVYTDAYQNALLNVLPKMSEENNQYDHQPPQICLTIVNNLQDEIEIKENENIDEE
jgi:hypothetical protein